MKEDILSKWLHLNQKTKLDITKLENVAFPLSYNQQALYFLYTLYPGNPFYNFLDFCEFDGNINLKTLIKSFEFLVERHEVFRTRFELREHGPVQIVESKGELEILLHEDADSQDTSLQIIIEDSRKPFDLDSIKKLRLSIVKVRDTKYYIGVCVHHIAIDKLSMSVLRKELAYVYWQMANSQTIDLKPLSTTFKEYAKKQTEQEFRSADLSYWSSKIDATQDILELPFDHPRPARPTFKGAHFNASLGGELTSKIQKRALEFNVTPFVLLLSAFYLLLYRYSNRRSINIGIPVTHKQSSDLENVVGFFDETLVLSTRIIQDKETFKEFVERVKLNVYEAFDHKEVPLEVILSKIKPTRISGVNPLFQVMFIFHKVQEDISFGEGIVFNSRTIDTGVSKFDLTLFIGENDEGFQTNFEYSTDLFKREKIRKIANHYKNIVEQIVIDSNIPISDVDLITEAEKRALLQKSFGLTNSLKPHSSILDLIEAQIDSVPDSIALADENERITYREMDDMSNRIAAFLVGEKCTSNQIIGLHFGRSIRMVVSILGVLKAGCAYLPLDPNYPFQRISFMAEDARASIIISNSDIYGINNVRVCAFNDILKADYKFSINQKPTLNDLCYVIYTSGSTGKPKGVAVNHLNLLNSTVSRMLYYQDPPKSFLLFSSFSFDSSLAGIFWTLASGGKLVIAAERMEQDMDKLSEVFREEKISNILLLPSLYHAIISYVNPKMISYLKNVIVAGEACTSNVAKMHFQTTKDARLYNEYGPTEVTVWATVSEITPKNLEKITIGKPIANTQVLVLDRHMKLVPNGAVGEIFLGGKNVAIGYLNNENETAKKFVKNPFEENFGVLYKTGDYAKIDEDGQILYLGRSDDQIKIRGHRIELNEIKNELEKLPNVEEAVVLVNAESNEGSEKNLLAEINKKSTKEVEEVLAYVERLSDDEIDFLLKQNS